MTRIDGKTPNSLPAATTAKIDRGIPKRTAMSTSKIPDGVQVKV